MSDDDDLMDDNPFPDEPLFSRCFDYSPPAGWKPIAEACIADIRAMLDAAGMPPGMMSVLQVKEKMGGLRIYVDGLPGDPQPDRLYGREDDEDNAKPVRMSRTYSFDDLGEFQFEDQVPDAVRQRVLAAIVGAGYVSRALAQQIFARIKVAADEAARTCQKCGQPGTLQIVANWRRTVCKKHRTTS